MTTVRWQNELVQCQTLIPGARSAVAASVAVAVTAAVAVAAMVAGLHLMAQLASQGSRANPGSRCSPAGRPGGQRSKSRCALQLWPVTFAPGPAGWILGSLHPRELVLAPQLSLIIAICSPATAAAAAAAAAAATLVSQSSRTLCVGGCSEDGWLPRGSYRAVHSPKGKQGRRTLQLMGNPSETNMKQKDATASVGEKQHMPLKTGGELFSAQ